MRLWPFYTLARPFSSSPAKSAAVQEKGDAAARAENGHKEGLYKVEVIRNTEAFDVIVDANDGTVLSVR